MPRPLHKRKWSHGRQRKRMHRAIRNRLLKQSDPQVPAASAARISDAGRKENMP